MTQVENDTPSVYSTFLPSQANTSSHLSLYPSRIPSTTDQMPSVNNQDTAKPASPPTGSATTSSFDLQELVEQYRSQPELLKLILTSKVEEDKRRAEEAKVRAKELDLYLQQRSSSPDTMQRHPTSSAEHHPDGTSKQFMDTSRLDTQTHHRRGSRHRLSITNRVAPYPLSQQGYTMTRRPSHQAMEQRRNSAAVAMVAMAAAETTGSPSPPSSPASPSPRIFSTSYPSPATDLYEDAKYHPMATTADESEDQGSFRPRRRREMQAITKIVETREFPYQDNYFWKNNGNTTQKKTGCKSIYYKCSNSSKGCPVNKTVTAKPSGEYLIKYRGVHLAECGRVERIRDL